MSGGIHGAARRNMLDNPSHLQRLFAGPAESDALAEWEREVQALRGAA